MRRTLVVAFAIILGWAGSAAAQGAKDSLRFEEAILSDSKFSLKVDSQVGGDCWPDERQVEDAVLAALSRHGITIVLKGHGDGQILFGGVGHAIHAVDDQICAVALSMEVRVNMAATHDGRILPGNVIVWQNFNIRTGGRDLMGGAMVDAALSLTNLFGEAVARARASIAKAGKAER